MKRGLFSFLLFRHQHIQFGSFCPRLSEHDGERLHNQGAQAAQRNARGGHHGSHVRVKNHQ